MGKLSIHRLVYIDNPLLIGIGFMCSVHQELLPTHEGKGESFIMHTNHSLCDKYGQRLLVMSQLAKSFKRINCG